MIRVSKMKLLKISLSDFSGESRNLREMDAARQMGFDVSVLCDTSPDRMTGEQMDGYPIRRIALLRRDKPLAGMMIRMIPGLVRWIRYIQKERPDVASCHDLIPLQIAYFAKIFSFRNRRMKLIYDSHELEMDRSLNRRRRQWMRRPLMYMEKHLIRKCEKVIVVSDGIADVLVDTYHLDVRPAVVRNIPNYWYVDEDVCRSVRAGWCAGAGWSEDDFIVIYQGVIEPTRGIEYAVRAVSMVPNCRMVLMGRGSMIRELDNLAEDLGIRGCLLFIPPVGREIIWKYVGAADAGFCILVNASRNHYLALPNKLFECIQAQTPVIASDFPEISKIVNGYGVGLCCRPDQAQELADCIRKFREQPEIHLWCEENCRSAKTILCWEEEKKILEKVYGSFAGKEAGL